MIGSRSLVVAVDKWKLYLLGARFEVHGSWSLKYLWEQQITTKQQRRWLVILMAYDFVIVYKKGADNKAADAISC